MSQKIDASPLNEQVGVCPWPSDRRWVYSITFDEALSELHRFAIPILDAHRVPGHLEVVVGQLGQVRRIGNSSFNGFHHMNGPELREMLARGWGVGNHTWSHEIITPETVEQELGVAKRVLEEAIAEPVTVYCSAGDNTNMSDHVLAACRRFGYLGAMSLTDALNRPDDADLLWINRTFLHTQGYGPFFSAFDPFRGIAYARRERGWLIDYLHCPLEQAVHPNKDCSAAELRDRIETVCAEGGDEVWLARVEDAVDYRYTRRALRIEPDPDGGVRLSTPGLHPAVRRRVLTLTLPVDTTAATIDGESLTLTPRHDKTLIDVDLSRPRILRWTAAAVPTRHAPRTTP